MSSKLMTILSKLCPAMICRCGLILCLLMFAEVVVSQEYLPGIEWPEPAVITPGTGGGPPADAVVLFDGTDMSAWEGGEDWLVENGEAVVQKHDIKTKQSFGDCQLHIEWSAPSQVVGKGQGRGNSGVFLMDTYEVQVLDSYDNATYFDGQAGAIYKQTPPMVNAMRPPGEWNAYDILWTRPHFNEDGSLKSPAYITLIHNGIVVLNHFELQGDTPYHRPAEYKQHADALPIRLQFHGNPVRYRNIWVREINPIVGKQVEAPAILDHSTGKKTPVE